MQTVELLKTCPEVQKSYEDRLHYIMVDEYQDTNTAQFELLRLLTGDRHNLCVVGDDDQSIYKFRGANIRNILDFEKYYPEATVIRLEQNYRSTQNVLDAANAVIRNNVGRKEKALWTEQGAGNRIHFRPFDTAYEEAEFTAGDIARRVRQKECSYKDCAVLYRTNAQARLLEERFVMEGVPYHVVGGVNFYARKEIKDLLAYLKTIDNGRDDLAVKRIINIPKRGIGAATIGRVQEYADSKGISFYDALKEAEAIPAIGRSSVKLKPFVEMIQAFRSKVSYYGLEKLVKDIIETTGYVEELEASDEEDAQARIENIDEFVSKVVSYEETHEEVSLSEFLEEVALVADIDSVDSDSDRVLLMTLHSAKGLEFTNVYLTGMEDGLFPSYMSVAADEPGEIEEERRLAYVGITRAKEDLTLCCAKARMIRGETQYHAVSRFVKEIPEELLDNRPPAPKPSPLLNGSASYRPVAAVKPRRTAEENKPFIASAGFGTASFGSMGIVKGAGTAAGTKPDYEEGSRVRHIKYGEGTVLSMEPGPRDYKVTVDFDEAGQKIMYAAFAKLKKV
jgi:DNA helicase-2/ATP-dependent DNA helicase PcrA